MGVAVMAVHCAGRHFFDWNDTTFELFTSLMFELDGCVADLEMVAQNMSELQQDASTL